LTLQNDNLQLITGSTFVSVLLHLLEPKFESLLHGHYTRDLQQELAKSQLDAMTRDRLAQAQFWRRDLATGDCVKATQSAVWRKFTQVL
jgi:hypothetical protein